MNIKNIGILAIKRFKSHYEIFILAFLIIFHAINNYIWLRLDTQPPLWEDQVSYLIRSLWIYDAIHSLSLERLVYFTMDIRPPLVLILATPVYFIAGTSTDAVIMANIFYVAMIILSVYGIAYKISNKKEIGLLSAFNISMFPMIFGMSRQFLVDLPLTAAVSMSILLLLYTEHFQNRTYSIFFGASLAFGMLIKPTFPIFIILPFLYVIKKDIKILNILSAILMAIGLASIWYIPNLNNVISYYSLTEEKASPAINLQNILSYPIGTMNYLISFIYFYIFIILIALTIFNNKSLKSIFNYIKQEKAMILILWIVAPYIIFTFLIHYSLKEFRFLLPLTPAIAIVISLLVDKIRIDKVKSLIVILILLAGLTQFFIMTYGFKMLPQEISFNTTMEKPLDKIILFSQEPRWKYPGYWEEGFTYPPKNINWRINDIFNIISEDSVKATPKVIIIPNIERFNLGTFWYYQTLYKKNIIINNYRNLQSRESLENYNYLIVKDHNNCGVANICNAINKSYSIFLEANESFYLLESLPLPDNSNVNIYRKNIQFGDGWHGVEKWDNISTQWISNNATIFIHNENNKTTNISFDVMSFYKPRLLNIFVNDKMIFEKQIQTRFNETTIPIMLRKGENIIRIHAVDGCMQPIEVPELNNKDTRCLSFAFQRFKND